MYFCDGVTVTKQVDVIGLLVRVWSAEATDSVLFILVFLVKIRDLFCIEDLKLRPVIPLLVSKN